MKIDVKFYLNYNLLLFQLFYLFIKYFQQEDMYLYLVRYISLHTPGVRVGSSNIKVR